MFKTINQNFYEMNRRRQMANIRQKFARCGYSLDDLDDSKIEKALTQGERRIEDVPLTAKSIYFALRNLAAAGGPARRRSRELIGK